VGFADDLHYSGFYTQGLMVLDRLLVLYPKSVTARALKGDILEHLERRDEAKDILLSLVKEKPDCERAWDVLSIIFQHQRDWTSLLWVSDNELLLYKDGRQRFRALCYRAHALLEQGDYLQVNEVLTKLSTAKPFIYQLRAKLIYCLTLLYQNQPKAALTAANQLLQANLKRVGQNFWFIKGLALLPVHSLACSTSHYNQKRLRGFRIWVLKDGIPCFRSW
jgi:tetratricopeptide (TPR) repeat protein